MDNFILRTTSLGRSRVNNCSEISLENWRCESSLTYKEDKTFNFNLNYPCTEPQISAEKFRNLEDRILVILTKALNEVHGVAVDKRFWQIILGHWMRGACKLAYTRLSFLEYAIKTYPISKIVSYKDIPYHLAPKDTNDFNIMINEDSFILLIDTLLATNYFSKIEHVRISNKNPKKNYSLFTCRNTISVKN